ncbi:MAG: Uma2 family endonuclease [Saprospiraceae bacterium]
MFTEETATLSEYETEREKPMPSKHHSFIQSRLLSQFDRRYSDHYTVLTEVSLNLPIRDRVPDLCVYPYTEFMGEEEIRMTDLPICIIEILSPTQNHIDLLIKRREYFDAGVKSYWLVFPDPKSVYVYSNPDEFEVYSYREVLQDPALEIELPLAEIFK